MKMKGIAEAAVGACAWRSDTIGPGRHLWPMVSATAALCLSADWSAASSPFLAPPVAESPGASVAGHVPEVPLPLSTGSTTVDPTELVTVWVDLDLPELASLPSEHPAERDALHQQIVAQQDEVMRRLRELGAIEQARVQLVRNALAVRLPANRIEAARQVPGVRAVRPVRNKELHQP